MFAFLHSLFDEVYDVAVLSLSPRSFNTKRISNIFVIIIYINTTNEPRFVHGSNFGNWNRYLRVSSKCDPNSITFDSGVLFRSGMYHSPDGNFALSKCGVKFLMSFGVSFCTLLLLSSSSSLPLLLDDSLSLLGSLSGLSYGS